jgi:hypothetical protein
MTNYLRLTPYYLRLHRRQNSARFARTGARIGLQFSSAAQTAPGKTQNFARSMWDPGDSRKNKTPSGATTCYHDPKTPSRQNPINPERQKFCPKAPLATSAKLESSPSTTAMVCKHGATSNDDRRISPHPHRILSHPRGEFPTISHHRHLRTCDAPTSCGREVRRNRPNFAPPQKRKNSPRRNPSKLHSQPSTLNHA